MDALFNILKNYNAAEIIIILVLLFVAVEWIVGKVKNIVNSVKKKKNDYHEEKKAEEDKEEDLDSRLSDIEKRNIIQDNSIEELCNKMNQGKDIMLKVQEDQNKFVIASSRSTLYRLSEDIRKKGFMTQIEYETFSSLSEVYIEAGGNHTMKDKIIPEILAMPIHYN